MTKILLIIFLLASSKLYADQLIKGIIKDKESKVILPFANITISNNKGGTISNSEGRFTLGISNLDQSDSIIFSYLGYKNFILKISEIKKDMVIYLEPVTIQLKEISISPHSLSVKEIIDSVKINFEENIQKGDYKKEIFTRSYSSENLSKPPLILKKIDYEGFNSKMVKDLLMEIPLKNTNFQDALVCTYIFGGETKLTPIEAISLEEKIDFSNKLQDDFDLFKSELEEGLKDPSIYYKVRSGIFAGNLNYNDHELSLTMGRMRKYENEKSREPKETICKSDSAYYVTNTNHLKNNLLGQIKYISNIENIHFLNSVKKYRYTLEEVTVFDDEMVYVISFVPKNRGLYRGIMSISTSNYAILQLDFEYDEGKHGKNINLLGVNYLEKYKKGKIIFESENGNYFLKYLYVEKISDFSFERNLSVSKKIKRFIGGKTVDEMKFEMQFFINSTNKTEILVINNDPIDSKLFNDVIQPSCLKYQKVYGYTPEMWKNNSIMEPSLELKKYKRKITTTQFPD